MKITIIGSSCSMGCMYAETNACQCACNGATHGMAVVKTYVQVTCSPAAEKRCKEGNETGECVCACEGINHGIYQHIENFEDIKITHYA